MSSTRADCRRATTCPATRSAPRSPWKGLWKHLDVTTGGQRIANAAWTYYEATPVCEPIRDFLAFYPNKVDAIDVDPKGER
jgi:uncharacterized protein (DUF427 family)